MIDQDLLITWGATHKKIRRKQIIFYEDDPAIYFHQILTGRVKMINTVDQSKEIIQGFYYEGDSFGEPPLFYNGLYPATALATIDTIMLRLPKESFIALMSEHKELAMKFVVLFANRLRRKSLQLKNIACNETEAKICQVLVDYKVQLKRTEKLKSRIDLTRQEIADMTGLRVETVIRSIKKMEGQGTLSIVNSKIFY
jgi:CRP/FNR family transcriptional regulator